MWLSVLLLLAGLAMIFYGANLLTDGASSIAKRMRVTPLVIGLTVVAMGTSAPEMAVSLTSAIGGKSDIALGNVVGSNIFNILAILGLTALVKPLKVATTTTRVEIPVVILLTLVVSILCLDTLVNGASVNMIDRSEGFVLLSFFILFMAYTMFIARREEPSEENAPEIKQYSLWLSILMVLLGLTFLALGGRFFTNGAADIARALGVSEAVIGLTLVALGTSIPELATSLVAARKGQVDMAIGNVVGSNIFNLLFILGTTAVIKPITISGITLMDYAAMLLAVVLLYLFTICFGQRKILRLEGLVLLLCFVAYNVFLVLR
ncbi:calcium/sodium antiporter [Porphyromonas circumdentaria]|uniref:Cation:H+ antiporter n=1 Tax=Porphyromonas circumdentaria TaxID=29524 RepID=A0A1T4Q3C0_9PORP|nr:calcium/sodium antiporter [Porphyromonas circumdentaria]MBB6276605.1 cation:H+ antiporter [Porphyromonas circumdentaria]MDO4722993.1 calcium/sodium antiporter [Porphyromonas circumdentaria]SJZ97981.1 cation:H+ antiporter [Porphyromonas circumdentaria]